MSAQRQEHLRVCLDTMTKLLDTHMSLVNTCMVDFIVRDMFSIIPQQLQQELLELTGDELVTLPSLLFSSSAADSVSLTKYPNLGAVIEELKQCRMENMNIATEHCEEEEVNGNGIKGLEYWDKIMAEKKTHEVEKMSKVIYQQVKNCQLSCLVDLGSGKAYLSQIINSLYKIPVLAIDGKETNTQGAQIRERKLKSKWEGLQSRAAERAGGEAPSTRKSRQKNGGHKKPLPSDEKEHAGDDCNLVTITKFVETGSDVGGLVEEHLPGVSARVGVVGLHTCGNLAPSSLETFLQSPRAKFLCNVGCCYNHLTTTGFPMSSHLKSSNYKVFAFVTIVSSSRLILPFVFSWRDL